MGSIIDFIRLLDSMDRQQLEEYFSAVWRGEIELTPQEEWHLVERLRKDRVDAGEDYVKLYIYILALLVAVPAYEGILRRVADRLVKPKREDYPWDLIWTTHPEEGEVCEKCQALEGKIYGVDFFERPELHPNCHCSLERGKEIGARAMNRIGIMEAGTVRALSDGQKRILEVLAAPFGSPTRKDKLGQFLSARTNFMITDGETRPLLYMHGFSPRGRRMKNPPAIGRATTMKTDEQGLWMRAELVPEGKSELADRTWKAALEGNARASTGSVNYLEDHDEHTGEVLCWPIAELSVFDAGEQRVPVSDDAVVLPLRALYDQEGITLPDNFEAGEDKREEEVKPTYRTKDNEMTEDISKLVAAEVAKIEAEKQAEAEAKAAMRAEIEKELKDAPNYRATFNVNGKVTGKDSPFAFRSTPQEREEFDKADLEETDAFLYSLMRPHAGSQSHACAWKRLKQPKVQGLFLLPCSTALWHSGMKYSLFPKIGINKMYTNSLTLAIPREDSGMGVFATIAEEGAYIANEPAFSAETVTVVKKGSMITATEELLEDSSIFEPYFVQLVRSEMGSH